MDKRINYLSEYIKNKSVLDFGCGGIEFRAIYKYINENSKYYAGIELDEERFNTLKQEGVNVYNLNAENFNLNKKFDTLFAGEFIEHLYNVGSWLECCKNHMTENSHLILTTPNAYSINRVLRAIFKLGNVPQFHEHTYLFTEQLLTEILTKHGFTIKKVEYFNIDDTGFKAKIINLFSKISPYFSQNIMIIAE